MADESRVAWVDYAKGFCIIMVVMMHSTLGVEKAADAEGWMHNRARMIVASFLVKDLLIDWRWGEAWFMEYLLDGDPAANNGGWQWTAGTGTDAAPYFRIFNPLLQSQKFDPHGDYIRRWVPELSALTSVEIHAPWKSDIKISGYPEKPIVDREVVKERTLQAYALSKNQK